MVTRGRGRFRLSSRPARTNPSRLRARCQIGVSLSCALAHGFVHPLAASFVIGTSASAILNQNQRLDAALAAGLDMSVALDHTPPVTPGSQTFTSGSGSWEVKAYNTLTVEMWGGGGAGAGLGVNGTSGGTSSISSLGLSATGGHGGGDINGSNGGAGGTGSGGDLNQTGGTGGARRTSPPSGAGGAGAGTGGGAGAPGQSATNGSGIAGSAPGGGGSGMNYVTGSSCNAGGGGGGKTTKTYTRGDSGAPVPGDLLGYVVGAGAPTTAGTGGGNGGAGGAGRVKFTWE